MAWSDGVPEFPQDEHAESACSWATRDPLDPGWPEAEAGPMYQLWKAAAVQEAERTAALEALLRSL